MTWGRLALLHAAGESDRALETIAQVLSYAAEPVDMPGMPVFFDTGNRNLEQSSQAAHKSISTSDFPALAPRPTARFLRVNKLEQLADEKQPDDDSHAFLHDPDLRLNAGSAPQGTYFFTPPVPLFAMPRLLPLLHNTLGQSRQVCKVDYSRLIRLIANNQPLRRLPQLTRLRWPQRLHVIVDTRTALEPYWSDFAKIIAQLKKLLSSEAVRSLRFADETFGRTPCYAINWPTSPEDTWFVWREPLGDEAILILSDLGSSDTDSKRRIRWQHFIQHLQIHSTTILTLSPTSHSPQNPWMCWLIKPNPLNDHTSLPRHPSRKGFHLTEPNAETIADILALLSPLPLIDSGLLRRLRKEFNWGSSDIEYRIWNHPDMRQTGLGIHLHENTASRYQQRYQQKFANTQKSAALWTIVQQHHQPAFEGLRQLEELNHCILENSVETETVRRYFRRLSASITQAAAESLQQQALLLQCRTVLQCLPGQVWQSQLADVAYDLYAMVHQDDIRAGRWPDKLESGFDPNRLLWVLDTKQQTECVRWSIHQTGPQGEFVCQQQSNGNAIALPLVQIEAHPMFPPSYSSASQESQGQHILRNGQTIHPMHGIIRIQTRWQQLELEAIDQPAWASDIWCNKQGLFVKLPPWRGIEHIASWQIGNLNKSGYWIIPEPLGIDHFGLFADLMIPFRLSKKLLLSNKAVSQRFRWIAPGSFMMGSPSSEPERYTDETRHEVTLSQGFWLADTACTQALWQAIMGRNPAHFQDYKNKPIETVNWLEVQDFISQLNKLFPDLSARLPTEAEWEYACRTGTATPFSFGGNITSEQVNYDGNFPYADGKKGLYRHQTVLVKSLPPNPWGLHEMHGNVWEWCADRYGEYSRQAVIDPRGPDQGTFRVLRGGSWSSYGRDARSALRYWNEPIARSVNVGFRFALS